MQQDEEIENRNREARDRREFPYVHSVRLSAKDEERLRIVMERLEMRKTEAIRHAIRHFVAFHLPGQG